MFYKLIWNSRGVEWVSIGWFEANTSNLGNWNAINNLNFVLLIFSLKIKKKTFDVKSVWYGHFKTKPFTLLCDSNRHPFWVFNRLQLNGTIPVARYIIQSAVTMQSIDTSCSSDGNSSAATICSLNPTPTRWVVCCRPLGCLPKYSCKNRS